MLFFHNIWWNVCLNKMFLSYIWFFKPRRYPASWAKHFPSTAQLAGSLLTLKNHTHERNIFFKPTFYQILWKNQQLLLLTCCFIFLPYSPYSVCMPYVESPREFSSELWNLVIHISCLTEREGDPPIWKTQFVVLLKGMVIQ